MKKTSTIALLIFALLGVFIGSQEQIVPCFKDTLIEHIFCSVMHGNSIIFNLSCGFLITFVFWYLQVYRPEKLHREIIKGNLANGYRQFKEDVICILISTMQVSYSPDLAISLCDPEQFKKYFLENKNERWYSLQNALENDPTKINDLYTELRIFSNIVLYTISNIKFRNTNTFRFFKRLSEHIYRIENCSIYSNDQVRSISGFLFEIFALWDIVEGFATKDTIQDTIDSI